MKLFFLMILAGAVLFAAEEAKKDAPKPPAISDKARAEFWKASAFVTQADAVKQAADASKRAAVDALLKECGDAWQLAQDPQTQEPFCMEKPKPVPAATDKK